MIFELLLAAAGMTAEQIDELGRELEKMGYKRRENVGKFALFVRKKPARLRGRKR